MASISKSSSLIVAQGAASETQADGWEALMQNPDPEFHVENLLHEQDQQGHSLLQNKSARKPKLECCAGARKLGAQREKGPSRRASPHHSRSS